MGFGTSKPTKSIYRKNEEEYVKTVSFYTEVLGIKIENIFKLKSNDKMLLEQASIYLCEDLKNKINKKDNN